MSFVAYVDESEPRQDYDPGTYLLSAAILDTPDFDAARAEMLQHRSPASRKAHWREATSESERMAMVRSVASINVEHLVVVRLGGVEAKPERRRRMCLERLMFELQLLGIERMIMESRGSVDDGRDRKMLDVMRARKHLQGALRMDHVPGPSEPLLWIPDVVCGAINRDRGGDRQYLEPLRSAMTMVEVRT